MFMPEHKWNKSFCRLYIYIFIHVYAQVTINLTFMQFRQNVKNCLQAHIPDLVEINILK